MTRYQPDCEKIMRMHAQTAMIENGFVSIPESAPWLPEYLHEMTVFPNGKHDDQVDSTAQFLDWFKKPFPGQNIFELYQREAEKLKHQTEPEKRKPPRPVNVRVKAPAGTGGVQTFSGRHINVGLDLIARQQVLIEQLRSIGHVDLVLQARALLINPANIALLGACRPARLLAPRRISRVRAG